MFLILGRPRVAIAGQVDQVAAFLDTKKVEMLRAPRHLADESEPLVIAQGIDGAGLSCIGAAREGNFGQAVEGEFTQLRDSSVECGVEHGRMDWT